MTTTMNKITALLALLGLATGLSAANPVKQLRQRLATLQQKGIMIGHQDDPLYGTTWAWDRDRSDVKETCGDYPAVMGFELGKIELKSDTSLDAVPFQRIREEIIAHHKRGGIVTISWHPWNPATGGNAWDPSGQPVSKILPGQPLNSKLNGWLNTVADFLKSLKTDGKDIPVVFRPWHEMHGGWFWWGKNSCTPEEFQQLFRYTVNYLKKQGVKNCLYCYSPGGTPNETEENYMKFYPGDKYVDMLGVDIYSGSDKTRYIKEMGDEFAVIGKVAREHKKLVCLSETGYRNTPDAQWFTTGMWEAIKDIPMSWVLLWRNAWDQPEENFGPAPTKGCAADFRQLYHEPKALFLRDICGLEKVAYLPTAATLLTSRLAQLQPRGYMFAHQDDPFYGVKWQWESNRSDTKETVGDYPAVMGFDLGGIEMDDAKNLDSVPFTRIREEIIKHHERGGIITISWHPRNPLTGGTAWDVANNQVVKEILGEGITASKFRQWMQRVGDFLSTLKTADGKPVPVIFRPWHENNGSWFWWGQKLCTDEEYHGLWNLLQDYLNNDCHLADQLVWSYSPNLDGNWTTERFMQRYPGNDRVTLIGEDAYQWGTESDFIKQVTADMDFLSSFAKNNGKLLAMTECGFKNMPKADWWTTVLKPVMDKYPISYFLLWRNWHSEWFGPYADGDCAADFKKLYEAENTLFLKDIAK